MISRRTALSVLPASLFGQRAKRKNVLIVMTDQHRPHALSIEGDPVARTPHLDALARTSVRFGHAYCTSPVCVPSRFGLMTGFYPHQGKVWGNLNAWPPQFKTLGDYFSAAGYRTANIGKLHAVDSSPHGFQEYLDSKDWLAAIGPSARLYHEETDKNRRDDRKGPLAIGGASKIPEEDHFESFVARESIRFLKQHRHEPFLLVSSFLKPHDPYTPAQRWAKMFSADQVKLPETWGKLDLKTVPRHIREAVETSPHTPELLDPENARKRIALYYANLAQADDRIGAVLDSLRELGLEDDTIVVYLADHGDMNGDKGLWLKFIMYENSVGVPFMFRVPGMLRGVRSERIASTVQLVATLAELCGVDVASRLDGWSLVESLRDPGKAVDAFAYAEINLNGPGSKQMLRRGDYKYCRNGNDMDQLYDLRRDPDEMTNLALSEGKKAVVERMKAEMAAIYTPNETRR